MTEEQLDLARRLVACEQWRWEDGMLQASPLPHQAHIRIRITCGYRHGWLPDLADHATAAILLRMAMEAMPPRGAWAATAEYTPKWGWDFSLGGRRFPGGNNDVDVTDLGTEAARALLAIWEKE